MREKREQEITQAVVKILKMRLNPPKIYIFGSRAKGCADKHSDFDFAVDCGRPSLSIQRELREKIDAVSGLYKVDIVYLRSIDKEFREIILNTARVVYP